MAVLAVAFAGGGAPKPLGRRAAVRAPAAAHRQPQAPPQVTASLAGYRLPAPVSREVVVPSNGGDLWVLGGLDTAGTTVATSYRLAPATGAVQAAGSLPVATHDAAGTLLGSSALVVGGGTSAPASEVQLATPSGGATVTGQLAVARSDARAVTIGRTAYVVGGYDGPAMDTAVLATTDGRTFHQIASLPVAVRYPTVAVVGGTLYVLGGQNANGTPVATVQAVDVRKGSARVVGSLGIGLAASLATTVDGTVYLAGGLVDTSAGQGAATATVYAYVPGQRAGARAVAALPLAVANAGGTRLGNDLYVVGGEDAAGAPVDDVQVVRFTAAAGGAGTPTSSSATTATSASTTTSAG